MVDTPAERLGKELHELIKKFLKTYKRVPTEKELLKLSQKIMLKFSKDMKYITDKSIKNTYLDAKKLVEIDLKTKIPLTKVDQNAVFLLKNNPKLYGSMINLSNEMGKGMLKILRGEYENPKGLNLTRLNKNVKELMQISNSKAELIARMELSHVSNAARVISYKKDPRFNEFLFKWVGPDDKRTTKQSKVIKKLVGKGVTWTELQNIVIRTAAKYFPGFIVNPETLVDHYNTRHSFVRTQILTGHPR